MRHNDSQVSVQQLKTMIQTFCEAREWDQFHSPKELAIGLVTEASELLEIFRFQSEDQVREIMADPKRREAVADELADSLFFVLRFSQLNGIDLAGALERKMEKNNSRYPVEMARGSNQKR
jgi:NTP pyrophosphatase (non-canonical NTP hydrolase)